MLEAAPRMLEDAMSRLRHRRTAKEDAFADDGLKCGKVASIEVRGP